MPKVSVIIPNYNHERYLPQRIESVLGQTFQDFDVVVLDDASTDGSRAVIDRYAAAHPGRVRTAYNAANTGVPFAQWNKGLGMVAGEYVWIAESDDYADPAFLEHLVGALDARPTMAIAFARSRDVSGDGVVGRFSDDLLPVDEVYRWDRSFIGPGTEVVDRTMLFDNAVPNASAVVFRRSAAAALGGADRTYRLAGDWKMWNGLALSGEVAYDARPMNYFRCHPTSVRTKTEKAGLPVEEWLRVLAWTLGRLDPPAARREEVGRIAYHRWLGPVLSTPMPTRRRLRIVRLAFAVDPHLGRRIGSGVARSVVRLAARPFRPRSP